MDAHDDPIHLALLLGSDREGRFGPVVADWFLACAQRRPGLAVELIDVAALDLPSRMPAGAHPKVDAYAARLATSDAIVVVTPEYNHSYPAALKQAIDLTNGEWRGKPVGFVSYGGLSGGLRAVEHLRVVFAELRAVTLRQTVSLHGAHAQFHDDGRPKNPQVLERAAHALLDELVWWAHPLRSARATTPYPQSA